jgi:HAD superfamily hydrolase (TIGR01549 family)
VGPAAICFDAFDTLIVLDDPVGRLVARLAAAGWQVPSEVCRAALRAEAALYRRLSLQARDAESLRRVRRACARRLWLTLRPLVPRAASYDDAWEVLDDSLRFVPAPGAVDCLRQLSALGLPLALASNWDCSLVEVLARLDLRRWFQVVAISALEGVEKPDPRLWRPVIEGLDLPPATIWHVGDEPLADGVGAARAGLRPVLLGPGESPPGGRRVARLADLADLVAARP